jgi:molybdopterin converting factor small subunit
VVIRVVLTGNFRQLAGGATGFEVEADNIRALFRAISQRYPQLERHLEDGAAVAIDGTIYQDDWFQPIADGSEVCVMPQIAGG